MTRFKGQDIGAMHDRDLARAIHRHCETRDAEPATWSTDDLLSGQEPPEVRPGVRLDARVKAVVRRDTDGTLELDSLDIGDVYLKPDSYDDILLLDQEALKTRHKALWEAFQVWLEAEALKQAEAAPDTAWELQEYEP